MQKLDRATLLELEWRDFLFWPLARPAGILYEFIRLPLARIISSILSLALKPRLPRMLQPETISKEILTLANWVTLYGLFLWIQLLYLIWAWSAEYAPITLYGITGFTTQPRESTVWIIALLIIEILFTDLVDGPLARVNNDVTALGTILDHTRDYLTAFTALFFLVAITANSGDIIFLILEAAVIGEFSLVMAYHQKLRHLFVKKESAGKIYGRIIEKILLLRRFALEEYQTPLTGRIQFGSLAAAIGFGLFHYTTSSAVITYLFVASLVATVMATSYYLYELWGEYYEKWRKQMHERSQHLKEKLVERVVKD